MNIAALKEFDTLLDNKFDVEDLICAILVETGYEDTSMPFDDAEFQRMLYRHANRIPWFENKVSFRTTMTFPYSGRIERALHRLQIAGVFSKTNELRLVAGTREYNEREFPDLSDKERNLIKELGLEFRKMMTKK